MEPKGRRTTEQDVTVKAAIYLRISLDATGEGLGVQRQLEDCVQHAALLGWEVVEVYRDNDISATSGKVRPEYRRMLADVDAGRIQGVIAWHADRLYRKTTDLGELVDICKRNDTQISTVRAGNIDLTTPTGRLVAGLLAQVATYEGEAKADRWKRSWRQGREAGKVPRTGSRMFGFTRSGEIVPSEAALARQAAAALLAGESIGMICRRWETAGILTTRGTTWRISALRQYLANPRLAGFSTLKGEIVGEGEWEPILDKDTWTEICALFKSRTRTYIPRVSLLNGLIFCGLCGHRLITGTGNSASRTYRCPNRPGMRGCGKVSAISLKVEETVEAYAKARLDQPEVRRRVSELYSEPTAKRIEIGDLQDRVRELERQLDEPGVPVETLLRAIDRTKERLEMTLAEMATRPTVPLPVQGGPWPEDLKRRRGLVDLVVAKVELLSHDPSAPRVFDPRRVKIDGR